MRPKVIDLFAGVGGLSLGFEKCGFDVILANEYDPSIAAAYEMNHKGTKMIVGDITALDLEKTFGSYEGKVDVVIGGPPCQGFSQKGQRKTIHDERNFLFKYYVRVVGLVKPRYFVMENVPNLLTAEGGYFRKEIEELFNSMGYQLKMGVLNASDYGVPQNRRRAVIIGKRNGDAPALPKPHNATVTIWDAISDLAYLNSGEGSEEQEYRFEPQSEYQKKLRNGGNHMEFLQEYSVPVIIGICLCVGYIIKHSLNFIPNKFIPLIMGLLGLAINIAIHWGSFSAEIVLAGLFSGLTSTGMHEVFSQLIQKKQEE